VRHRRALSEPTAGRFAAPKRRRRASARFAPKPPPRLCSLRAQAAAEPAPSPHRARTGPALDPRSSRLIPCHRLETTVFLVHPGTTNWHRDGLLLGRRDIPMNDHGKVQAERVAGWLAGTGLAEVISSPLQRALQTATIIGKPFGIDVARDHRLIDFNIGLWEGKPAAEVMASDEYGQFAANPLTVRVPGGESLHEVKTRAVSAVEQTLEDNPAGATIALVTHARVIRVLLTHYMGAPPSTYHCLRIHPGSISVLAFSHESQRPRVLAINWSGELRDVMAEPEQPV
jgi:broad specificity phosphatase PhoE